VIYLTRADGSVIGKFSEEDLRAKIARGDVSPDDQYLAEASAQWKRLTEFPNAAFPWPVSRDKVAKAPPTRPLHQRIRNVLIILLVLLGLVLLLRGTRREASRASSTSVLSQIGAQAEENMALVKQGKMRVGMIEEQVEMAWGKPDHVNRYSTANGEVQQWVYSNGDSLTFTNGILRSMLTTRRQ
jgi:hypothetical protein